MRREKNWLKIILSASLLLLCVFLVSCATNPPDIPVCTEITPDSGYCVKVISGEHFVVDENKPLAGRTWWESKPYMIQMPPSSWRELKAFIIKMCKRNNQCQKEVASWERTIKIIDENLGD